MSDRPRCLFCAAPATHFCDRAIALVDIGETEKPKGKPPYRITSMKAMLSTSYTCDAPVCDRHRHVVGFICGKQGDTIDYCEGCYGVDHGLVSLMSSGAIDSVRKQMHARYRRALIEVVT